ncbi:alpha/beta hydrolase [Kineococcus rubinsiae]|uniref:alpha/beta hydrolase n=1 Tax=Kineococcus rubinsiae TaxID=2609562 RepID=UPI001AD90EA8|nr:alpha/beta hydrolase [Kineococcus rubinsiae]
MSTPPAGFPLPPPEHLAPLPPARTTADGVRVHSGVVFAALPGVRPLELDLHLPPATVPGPVPVVVFLHGGGWRAGSRRSAGPAFAGTTAPQEVLARAGTAVASVDYRLSGEAVWPAPLHDAKAAVRWLRARAGDLGVDPDRVGAWGESAGAHLAALLGLTAGQAHLEGSGGITGPASAVRAVAAWYPPTDLTGLAADLGADPDAPDSREAQLLGAPVSSVPETAAEASPLTHALAGAGAGTPFLLLHGGADRLVPAVQSARLAAALRAAGGDVEHHVLPGADHLWRGSADAGAQALARTVAWLHEHL